MTVPPIMGDDLDRLEGLSAREMADRIGVLAARVTQGASNDGVAAAAAQHLRQSSGAETTGAWVSYAAASRAAIFLPELTDRLSTAREEIRAAVIAAVAWNRSDGVNAVLLDVIQADASADVRRLALKYLVRPGSLGEWEPTDLTSAVREADWRPVTRREYETVRVKRTRSAGENRD